MRTTILLAILTILLGCSTPYQKDGNLGGFSETQLGENAFKISFNGNAFTDKEKVADYTLLRSAEVTKENGYRYFVIVDSSEDSTLGTYTTPTRTTTTGSAYASGNYVRGNATSRTTGGQTYIYSSPSAENTIICYEDKPEVNGLIYEAAFIVRSIKDKYDINE